jgi:hypothetical protein
MNSPSRVLRLALESRFSSDFNPNLAAAWAEIGIVGLQPYSISFDEAGSIQNFYRGNRTLDSLWTHQEPELPALAMWIGPGQNQTIQKPRMFSGPVTACWRFFLAVQGLRKAGLTDMREATEAAMVATLDPEIPSVGYRGDLLWQPVQEQIWLDLDSQTQRGWVQEVEFQATFEVDL